MDGMDCPEADFISSAYYLRGQPHHKCWQWKKETRLVARNESLYGLRAQVKVRRVGRTG